MKRKKRYDGSAAQERFLEINVTPLADVALVLVIILMLLTPVAIQSMIKIRSQGASRAPWNEVTEKPLFVEITLKGNYLNTAKVRSEEDLFLKLQSELKTKSNKQVIVTANKEVMHGMVVHILDIIKQSGADKISMVRKA